MDKLTNAEQEQYKQLHEVLLGCGFKHDEENAGAYVVVLGEYVQALYYSIEHDMEVVIHYGSNGNAGKVSGTVISTSERIPYLDKVWCRQAIAYFTRGYHLAGRAGMTTHTATPTQTAEVAPPQVQTEWLTAEQARATPVITAGKCELIKVLEEVQYAAKNGRCATTLYYSSKQLPWRDYLIEQLTQLGYKVYPINLHGNGLLVQWTDVPSILSRKLKVKNKKLLERLIEYIFLVMNRVTEWGDERVAIKYTALAQQMGVNFDFALLEVVAEQFRNCYDYKVVIKSDALCVYWGDAIEDLSGSNHAS